jgi:uncharacterized protein YjaZ
MKKAIEKELKQQLDNLKPEFKKLIYLFDEKISYSKKKCKCGCNSLDLRLGSCSHLTNPKVITFYLGSIEKMFQNRLKQIIRHEIVHNFTLNEEDAYNKQNNFKVF